MCSAEHVHIFSNETFVRLKGREYRLKVVTHKKYNKLSCAKKLTHDQLAEKYGKKGGAS